MPVGPLPMVFGDSYGQVQAAAQQQEAGDRNWLLALMTAQRAAQQMALDQANQQQRLAMSWNLSQQERADRASQLAAARQEREEERALAEDLGIAKLQQDEDRIAAYVDLANKKIAAMHQDKFDTAKQAGPVLASRFSELIRSNLDADADYKRAYQELIDTEQEKSSKLTQGLIQPVRNAKGIFRATSADDKIQQQAAEDLNKRIQRTIAAFNAAKDRKLQAERDYQTHLRLITSSGFVPGEGQLLYPKTGQSFQLSLPQATSNSPRVFNYNPRTGKLE